MLKLLLPEAETKPIGVWGQRHRRYLKEHESKADGRENLFFYLICSQLPSVIDHFPANSVFLIADKNGCTRKIFIVFNTEL